MVCHDTERVTPSRLDDTIPREACIEYRTPCPSSDVRLKVETNVPKEAVETTVESLKWIYGVVIALSISEAFMQATAASSSGVPEFRWDRFLSLCSFLLLVVPFYHGMTRYFCDMYDARRVDSSYGAWLLVDCGAFTVEAGLFFVLTCYLPKDRWGAFTVGVAILLCLDVLWGALVWRFRKTPIGSWVVINLCTLPFLGAIVLCLRHSSSWWGVSLAFVVILARTVADYWTGWTFYFPR